jgi:hypothetical protein
MIDRRDSLQELQKRGLCRISRHMRLCGSEKGSHHAKVLRGTIAVGGEDCRRAWLRFPRPRKTDG